MFVATTFKGIDVFANDLETLKTADEQHLNGEQIAEELQEELEALANDGEETYTYQTEKYEFHFSMTQDSGIILNIHYDGYTEC